ncbi:hypothetical protein [Oceanobacillus salinisoli]|uniref:hypothetical protein n=1 Tax=Oceanobacillus salinisoli TaxID=2678611 RepID=UPI0012E24A28|nr:hypothetical protein [Oceanobacillus salinisoli]
MKNKKVVEVVNPGLKKRIEAEIEGMKFTKNMRSATAEEWYVFLPGFHDRIRGGGAAGKVIVHYNLWGHKNIFINTTIIFDDPHLYDSELHPLVYALADEIVNRLVGYADTLLSVHAGENTYSAEYKSSS